MLRPPMYKVDSMQDEISNISKQKDGETKKEQAEMVNV